MFKNKKLLFSFSKFKLPSKEKAHNRNPKISDKQQHKQYKPQRQQRIQQFMFFNQKDQQLNWRNFRNLDFESLIQDSMEHFESLISNGVFSEIEEYDRKHFQNDLMFKLARLQQYEVEYFYRYQKLMA